MTKVHIDTDSIDIAVAAAIAAGLCVVPTRSNSKAPIAEWKAFQTERPSGRQINRWYGYGRTGMGLICGVISGGLEVLDFDVEEVYLAYVEKARQVGLGDLVDRIEAGYLEATPNGGRHWPMYVPTAGGNVKLACRPKTPDEKKHPKDNTKTLIETRGEGGYCVVAPTHGYVHETHKPYVLISGSFDTIATITEAERDALHTLARTFDLTERTQQNGRGGPRRADAAYNTRATWPELLEPEGWVQHSEEAGVTYWTRPGKDFGVSATTNYMGIDLLRVFSSSTDFDTDRSYTRFGAYAVLHHGGDFAAAARAQGMTVPRSKRATESIATCLLKLAKELYEPVMDLANEPYVVPIHGARLAIPLKSSLLRAELAATFNDRYGKIAGSNAINDTITVLHGWAAAKVPIELALRSAAVEGGVVLDLGTKDGACVVIHRRGWKVEATSPVIFRRTELTGALPIPEPGGSLDELRALLNVSDHAWPLLLAWQITALIGRETPVAAFTGEAGAGKTTAARMTVCLTDETPTPTSTCPRNIQDWVVAASGSRIVGLDNVSQIFDWLSDALCRAVTGDALVRRKLYTDSDRAVVALRRAVVFTSIDAGVLRDDLAERILMLELEPIEPGDRLSDAEVERRWQETRADALAGFLDVTVEVLAVLRDPVRQLAARPRMASFAEVLHAVDEVMETNGLTTYLESLESLKASVLDGDLVAQAVIRSAYGKKEWVGTATELLAAIGTYPLPHDWPANAAALGGRLMRAMSVLRQNRVRLDRLQRTGGTRRLRISDLDHLDHVLAHDIDDPDDV